MFRRHCSLCVSRPMKCQHCGKKFPANIEATWPGGFDSPGVFFYFGILLFIAATILYLFSIEMWWWIVLAV